MHEQMLFDGVSSSLQYGIVNIGDMVRNDRSFDEQVEQCAMLIGALVFEHQHQDLIYQRLEEAKTLDARLSLGGRGGETAARLAHRAIHQALEYVKIDSDLQSRSPNLPGHKGFERNRLTGTLEKA